MGELLTRRALMLPGEVTPREWDYEWDYTKGLLDSDGWEVERVGSGSSSVSINSGGYLRFQGTSSTYYNYFKTDEYTQAVAEFEVYMEANQNVIRLNVGGNETYNLGVRMQVSSNYKGLYLGTSVSSTKLATISYAQKYKVKLVLNGSVGQVYLDDALIADDIDTSANLNCNHAFVSGRSAGSTVRYNRLYSVKMKFGRI